VFVSRPAPIVLIILVVVAILLCAIVAGFYWATGPSLRCHRPTEGPAEPGWSARIVASGGRDRCYYLYTPPQYDPGQPLPLVFSLHGFMSNPNSHALITKWHKLAKEEGFLLVYPQGTEYPQRWDAGETWGVSDTDDVQFYHDMLADVASLASVDESRIYVNGFSNGGGMTVDLGCKAADTFAAMGTVSAAVVATEDCAPDRPMPAIVFHGTADPIVPYEGGEMGGWLLRQAARATNAPPAFAGVEDWVAYWAESNGCDLTPRPFREQGDARGIHYSECGANAEVILYTIEDGGHSWPGGFPIPGVGKTSRDIDATEEMWKFFQMHTLGE